MIWEPSLGKRHDQLSVKHSCEHLTPLNVQPGQESEGRPRERPGLDRTQPEPKDFWKDLKLYLSTLIEPERICRKIQNISKFRPETQK